MARPTKELPTKLYTMRYDKLRAEVAPLSEHIVSGKVARRVYLGMNEWMELRDIVVKCTLDQVLAASRHDKSVIGWNSGIEFELHESATNTEGEYI